MDRRLQESRGNQLFLSFMTDPGLDQSLSVIPSICDRIGLIAFAMK